MDDILIEEFNTLAKYYKNEAKEGRYHNPYDVDNRLNEVAMKMKDEDNRFKYRDLAHDVGMYFWDM